jgi:hypothetical protein
MCSGINSFRQAAFKQAAGLRLWPDLPQVAIITGKAGSQEAGRLAKQAVENL